MIEYLLLRYWDWKRKRLNREFWRQWARHLCLIEPKPRRKIDMLAIRQKRDYADEQYWKIVRNRRFQAAIDSCVRQIGGNRAR